MGLRLSITARLVGVLVVLTTLVLASVGVWEYTQARATGEARLARVSKQVSTRLGIALGTPLADADRTAVQQTIAAELDDPEVLAIQVLEADGGKTFIGLARADALPGGSASAAAEGQTGPALVPHDEPLTGDLLEARAAIRQGKQEVGTAVIQITRQEERRALRAVLLGIVVKAAVLDAMIVLVLTLALRAGVVVPLLRVVGVLEAMAGGDTSRRVPTDRKDEFGRLAQAVNVTVDNMQRVLSGVTEQAGSLAGSVHQLTAVADEVAGAAGAADQELQAVTIASHRVAEGVQAVAAACTQMGSSIQEIARSTTDVKAAGDEATAIVSQATERVAHLGEASAQIGSVVGLITTIAQQTNLLALNATIEAAHAGEAGKGFAVVANEVKELARRTAKATAEIAPRIATVQQEVDATVGHIRELQTIVERMGTLQTGVAAAVEQQTATTNEIGRNSNDVATNANDISAAITRVAEASKRTVEASATTRGAATDLDRLAMRLTALTRGQ